MTEIWTLAALWLGLALLATLLSIWLRIATALSEIVVGTIAQLVIGAVIGAAVLGTDQTWVKFLSGTGAILLTFLAGAELDPVVFRERWKEAGAVGVISFLVPFIGCGRSALLARMGPDGKLACRGGNVHDLGSCRLCGDAGVRLQRD
jgi:glutathione-regulated potassium-efflux system ancillary protein KefC